MWLKLGENDNGRNFNLENYFIGRRTTKSLTVISSMFDKLRDVFSKKKKVSLEPEEEEKAGQDNEQQESKYEAPIITASEK